MLSLMSGLPGRAIGSMAGSERVVASPTPAARDVVRKARRVVMSLSVHCWWPFPLGVALDVVEHRQGGWILFLVREKDDADVCPLRDHLRADIDLRLLHGFVEFARNFFNRGQIFVRIHDEKRRMVLVLADVVDRRRVLAIGGIPTENAAICPKNLVDGVDSADWNGTTNIFETAFLGLQVLFIGRQKRDEMAAGGMAATDDSIRPA